MKKSSYQLNTWVKLTLIFVVIAILAGMVLLQKKYSIFAEVLPSSSDCKWLIAYDRDGGQTPNYLTTNLNLIEQNDLPFDGVVIHSDIGNRLMSPGVVLTSSDVSAEFQGLKNMPNKPTKLKHNLVRVLLKYPGDFYSDADWQRVANNMAVLAQGLSDLKNSGFGVDGIFYDNEGPYEGETCAYKMWDYPRPGEGEVNPCMQYASTQSLQNYQGKVRQRGKEIMSAMINNSQFKDIRVLTLLDSYLSCSNNFAHPYDNDLFAVDELLGAFTLGLTEATVGTAARVTDGGEYSYYIGADPNLFSARYNYRKTGMPADPTCDFISQTPDFRSLWPSWLNVGHGLYNFGQNETNISQAVQYALQNSDDYDWFYTEGVNSLDPAAGNFIGSTWFNNLLAGRRAVPNSSSCGSSTETTVNLKIKLQGKTDQSTSNTVLKIYDTSGNLVFAKTDVSTDPAGNAQVTLPSSVTLGQNYQFFLKPQYYLADVTWQTLSGSTNLNFADFKGGDFNNDNKIDNLDYNYLTSHWATNDQIADVFKDGQVNTIDFAILSLNWLIGT